MTTRKEANDLIVEANALVMKQGRPYPKGPYKDVVRATLALQRGEYETVKELTSGVIGFLTPREK